MLSHQSFQLAKVFQRVRREVVPAWSVREIEHIEAWVRDEQMMCGNEMDQHTSRVRAATTLAEMQARSRTAKQFAADAFAPRMAMMEDILDAVLTRLDYLNDSSNDAAGSDDAA